jgi:hypothetical protein
LESSSLQLKKIPATGDFGIVGMAIVSAFATTLAKKKRALVQCVRTSNSRKYGYHIHISCCFLCELSSCASYEIEKRDLHSVNLMRIPF